MDIDTGSALTLISQATFSKLWPGRNAPHLESTSVRLRTYSGEELRVVGRAVVRVRCGGQVEDLGLVVVEGSGPSLLGRDCLERLRLDWGEVRKLHASSDTLKSLLAKHVDLFRDELGTIKGVTAKLHVSAGGSIRVCGDYKFTINQVALVDTYPLPLVQDIFVSLANGSSFTKLDLAHAYQQLSLDDESRPYITINTH